MHTTVPLCQHMNLMHWMHCLIGWWWCTAHFDHKMNSAAPWWTECTNWSAPSNASAQTAEPSLHSCTYMHSFGMCKHEHCTICASLHSCTCVHSFGTCKHEHCKICASLPSCTYPLLRCLVEHLLSLLGQNLWKAAPNCIQGIDRKYNYSFYGVIVVD